VRDSRFGFYKFWVEGLQFGAKDVVFEFLGMRHRILGVEDSGFRVQGLGFMVWV
jgi:hypothetical protein